MSDSGTKCSAGSFASSRRARAGPAGIAPPAPSAPACRTRSSGWDRRRSTPHVHQPARIVRHVEQQVGPVRVQQVGRPAQRRLAVVQVLAEGLGLLRGSAIPSYPSGRHGLVVLRHRRLDAQDERHRLAASRPCRVGVAPAVHHFVQRLVVGGMAHRRVPDEVRERVGQQVLVRRDAVRTRRRAGRRPIGKARNPDRDVVGPVADFPSSRCRSSARRRRATNLRIGAK